MRGLGDVTRYGYLIVVRDLEHGLKNMLVVLLGYGFIPTLVDRSHRFSKLTYFDSDECTLVRTFLSPISDHTHLFEFQVEGRPRSLNPGHHAQLASDNYKYACLLSHSTGVTLNL